MATKFIIHRKNREELDCIFGFVNESLKLIRTKGLSTKNINLCLKKISRQLHNRGARIDRVCQSISRYLQEEQGKLTDEKTVWHASGDIMESIFGFYPKLEKKKLVTMKNISKSVVDQKNVVPMHR